MDPNITPFEDSEGVPRKRRRIALEVEHLLNDIFQDTKEQNSIDSEPYSPNNDEGVSGKIQSVRLQNFMCHSNMEFTFGDKINFISGKNGSGKSAILTALVIGLGGRTADTNRGQSLRNLIQNGKNRASIEITMSNTGPAKFKPYLYGSSIKVIRTLTGSSSQYKILSEKGEVVSTKRDDLDLINMYFNIQVNNPVIILNQDTARTFIKTAAPRELYNIFMKGTHLEEIEQRNLSLKQEKIPFLEKLIHEKKDVLQEAYADIYAYNEKLKKIKKLEKYEDEARVIQTELFWAYVYKIEEKYNAQKAIEHECESKLPKIKEKVDKRDQIEQELKDKQKIAETTLREQKGSIRELENNSLEIEQSLRSSKEQIGIKINEIQRVQKKLTSEKSSCDEIQTEIDNHESRSAEVKAEKARLDVQKCDLEKRLVELKAVLSTTVVHRQQLNDTMSVATNKLTQKEQFYNNLKQKLVYKEEYLKGLKTETNLLMVYSKWMPQLVDNIERAYKMNKFHEKPRGPLGSYIQVKEKSWGPAIENYIGAKTLSSFCVDNNHDYKVLKSLVERIDMPAKLKPSITISKFFNQVHDVRKYETGNSQYKNLLRSITVTDPVAANALIDAIEPETVLLVPTSEEAYKLLEDINNVPLNCKRAFTKTGDLFYPAPNYRSYAGTADGTRYLQISPEQAIQLTTKEVETIKEELNNLDDGLEKARIELVNSTKKLEEVNHEVHKLNRQITFCENKLDEIKREELPETYDVKLLKEDLEYRQKTIKTCEETLETLGNEKTALIVKYKEVKEQYEKIQALKTERSEEISKTEAEIAELNNEYHKITANRNHYVSLLKTEEAKLANVKKAVADLQKEVEKAERDAKEAHPERIHPTRDIEILEKNLSKINSMMKALEKLVGDRELVPDEYVTRLHDLQEKHNALQHLTCTAEKLKVVVDILDDSYGKLKNVVWINTKQTFLSMLEKKKFKGDLVIDHEKKMLKVIIKVESGAKDGSATLTLSGGERSYSMVSFIMALWKNMSSPFFFLDEFDVFMDEINRNMIMNLLLNYAKNKPEHQFVFLTPHGNLPNELLSEVHFFRMNDPRSQERNTED